MADDERLPKRPRSFIESAFATKVDYEASLKEPVHEPCDCAKAAFEERLGELLHIKSVGFGEVSGVAGTGPDYESSGTSRSKLDSNLDSSQIGSRALRCGPLGLFEDGGEFKASLTKMKKKNFDNSDVLLDYGKREDALKAVFNDLKSALSSEADKLLSKEPLKKHKCRSCGDWYSSENSICRRSRYGFMNCSCREKLSL